MVLANGNMAFEDITGVFLIFMKKVIAANVEATLTDGKAFVSKKWKTVFIVLIILCGLMLLSILMLIVGIVIEGYDDESFAVILGMSVALILCGIATTIIGYFIVKWKKVISLWLDDAVILEANSKRVGQGVAIRFPLFAMQTSAIEVSFFYNNVQYNKRSEYGDKLLSLHVFNKFTDKKIQIAYSAKYDKVMLLNPEKDFLIPNAVDKNNKSE